MNIETQVYPYIKERDENDSGLRDSTTYYLELFKEYEENKFYKIKWNFGAAVFGGLWMAYRAMYSYAIAWMLVSGLLLGVLEYCFSEKIYSISCWVLYIVEFIAFGCFGNWLYIRFIKKEMKSIKKPAEIRPRNILYFWLLCIIFGVILMVIVASARVVVGFMHKYF